jgi:hypothetical protein
VTLSQCFRAAGQQPAAGEIFEAKTVMYFFGFLLKTLIFFLNPSVRARAGQPDGCPDTAGRRRKISDLVRYFSNSNSENVAFALHDHVPLCPADN